MTPSTTGRPYDSPLRRRRAGHTRETVIRAAIELFSERGYTRTTVNDIAKLARVSAETVQKVGPKREFLMAAALPTIFGATAGGDILDSDFVREAAGFDEPSGLVGFLAGVYAEANQKTFGIWRAWRSAALEDPELAEQWQQRMTGIRDGFARSLPLLAARGWLRDDVPADELASSFWLLTLPEVYERLTLQAGMTHEGYAAWLARSLYETLIAAPHDPQHPSKEHP